MEYRNIDVRVYVVEKTPDMAKMRNALLRYIGGQTHVLCSEHKLPLIVAKDSVGKCYLHVNGSLEYCNRKLYLKCPDFGCKSGLCKRCYQQPDDDDVVYINPPDVDLEDDTSHSTSLSNDIS